MPTTPQDIYARLLSSPRGYPLWTPEPSNELLEERREGLRIGDVGVVLDDGGFDVLFNLCLPADHPFHLRHGVPDGFTFINPGLLDIRTVPNSERPGRILSSSSVARDESAEDVTKRHDSSVPPYRFSLSSSEGALLILPDGAERYDLLSEHLFLKQAILHGATWYHYAVNRRHRLISPDALYLITGMHKTRAWSVAAFENTTANQRHTAHFKQIQSAGTDETTYTWETTCCALDWRVGPYVEHGIPNQAVFIRGLKIALRNGFLGTRWISVEADAPSTRFTPVKSTSIVPSNSLVLDSLARFFGHTGSSVFQATRHNEGPTLEDVQQTSGGHDGMHVNVERVPNIPPAFHPSDAINRYLFTKDPSANIAITSDSVWISLLSTGYITLQDLQDEARLEVLLSDRYRIVSCQGVASLGKRPTEPVVDYSIFQLSAVASTSTGHALHFDMTDVHTRSELTDHADGLWNFVLHDEDIYENNSPRSLLEYVGPTTPPNDWDTGVTGDPGSPQSVVNLELPPSFEVLDGPGKESSAPMDIDNHLPDSNDRYVKSDDQALIEGRSQTQRPSLSDYQSSEYTCRWMTNGIICGTPVQGQDFPVHLRTVHDVKNTRAQRIFCGWAGCHTQVTRETLIRHIREVHLRYRRHRCASSRSDTLNPPRRRVNGLGPISQGALHKSGVLCSSDSTEVPSSSGVVLDFSGAPDPSDSSGGAFPQVQMARHSADATA